MRIQPHTSRSLGALLYHHRRHCHYCWQTVGYSYAAQADPRMRLHGIVFKQRPHPSNSYSPGMSPELEQWSRLVLTTALEEQSWSYSLATLGALLSPLPPLQTSALISYFALLRWFEQ